MTFFKKAASAMALMIASVSVSAATITFDLGLSSEDGGPATFPSAILISDPSGLTLTAANSSPQVHFIYRVGIGMGLTNDDGDTSTMLDSKEGDEGISFSFNQDVIVESIVFKAMTSGEEARITGLPSAAASPIFVPGASASVTYTPVLNNVLSAGSAFEIAASMDPFETQFDRFLIDSITVSAVPVPAAAWLFGSALAGMIGLRRRQQRA